MFLKESPLFTPVKIIACAKIIYSFETHTISIDTSVILIESSLSFPSVKHKIITADGCHHYNYSTLALLKITHVSFLLSFGL